MPSSAVDALRLLGDAQDKTKLSLPMEESGELEIDRLSNRAPELIRARRFDEAEEACRELERKFPEYIVWIDRTALLHEQRGEKTKAAEYYRRCLEFIENDPEGFEEDVKLDCRSSIQRLIVVGDH